MARTYLVVVDDSTESRTALRFAARRAVKTNGTVEVLAIVPPQDFVQLLLDDGHAPLVPYPLQTLLQRHLNRFRQRLAGLPS